MFDEITEIIPNFSDDFELESIKFEYKSIGDGLLVRTPNWLGDAVMTFPALKQLRAMLPATCGLFVVCPKGMYDLFDSLNIVDGIIPLENPHAFPTRSEYKTIRDIHAKSAIFFNNSFRDALAFRIAGVRNLFGAAARNRSFLMKKAWKFPPRIDHELNSPHQAVKYLAMARALGAPSWDGVLPALSPKTGPETFGDKLKNVIEHDNILIMSPGAAYGGAKCWDAQNFRSVADYWINKRNGIVAAVGGGKEFEACQNSLVDLPRDRALNLAGETTLSQLIYLLQHSSMCIANDSGVMHLAAACGLSGVAPFGSTDPVATSPLSHNWRIVYKKSSCSPCFKRVCPYGDKHCFEPITPDTVTKALESLICD